MLSKAGAGFMIWVKSPMGPKSVFFWAPVVNWLFPIQGLYDWNRSGATISKEMQFVLCGYSGIFIRFAWRIKPRSYVLLSMHCFNLMLQGRLLHRRYSWEQEHPEEYKQQLQYLEDQKKVKE